ncbi:MAG: hypothetical protein NT144_14065 [Bacteroidia bacterium]|nr:hypothetical protein [Bacteroidia bacterium]
MRSIIIGNGVNIQFGGSTFNNESIIKRAIFKLESGDFCNEVYTSEIGTWLKYLFQEFPGFLDGYYDRFTVASDEREELESFKKRYRRKTKIYEIGFEDFFLMNELCCRNNKIKNPERFDIQEILRRLFLDSIFNNGKINDIHRNFPKDFIEYIKTFDSVFTTNYDRNIELSIKRDVFYLHGAFHVLDDLYNPDGFRNQLPDRPADKVHAIKGFEHAFSTALTGNSGFLKQFTAENAENTNAALETLAAGMKNDPKIAQDIESWKDSDKFNLRNFYEAIKLRLNNPDFKFPIVYEFSKLNEIKGRVIFIGLSPNNDSHIFSSIHDNISIESVEYFYYEENEKNLILSYLHNKQVDFLSVKDYWKGL